MVEHTSPRVSVVVAVRNGASFLDVSLRSVLAQSFDDFELIVIDDGSTDETPGILSALQADSRVKVVRQSNRGLAASLNVGIDLASSEYVARHDGDDISAPDRFERQVRYLDAHPSVGAVGTRANVIDAHGATIGVLPWLQGTRLVRRHLRDGRITLVHGSMMMRRAALNAVGKYREAFAACQDYDLWLRLNARWDIDNLPETLYGWRLHDESVYATRRARQLQFLGIALAFAHERAVMGGDSYDTLHTADGDLDAFVDRYAFAGRVHATWGELWLRGVGNSPAVRAQLRRALAQGSISPRTLGLFAWTHLGLAWPGSQPLALGSPRAARLPPPTP